MGEDILSVIFLALICIVISGIAMSMSPPEMMMPTFALVAVCLWIALDYMLIKRHHAKQACATATKDQEDIEKQIDRLADELENGESEPEPVEEVEDDANKPKAKHKNEFDIAMYDKKLSTEQLYKDSGCAGDTSIANRMKYMGLQARMSQDIRAKWNVEKYRQYVEEELRTGEERDWWENEADYLDALM
jgi:hypothetical protein